MGAQKAFILIGMWVAKEYERKCYGRVGQVMFANRNTETEKVAWSAEFLVLGSGECGIVAYLMRISAVGGEHKDFAVKITMIY